MRTTVTLDPDVAERLKQLAHRRQTSFKETLNEVIRRGLGAQEQERPSRFRVKPHDGAFKPGIDLGKLNQLVDELESADFTQETRSER